MTTQELHTPETGVDPLIAIRRQMIVEKACQEFNTNPAALRAMRSSEQYKLPWFQLCGLIAHLLKRDTNANNKEVADLIDCNEFDVGMFGRDIRRVLSTEESLSKRPLHSRLHNIVDAVQTAIERDEKPKYRIPERRAVSPPREAIPVRTSSRHEQVTEAVLKEVEHRGITLGTLTGEDQRHGIVEVRDVWIFLLRKYAGLKDGEITVVTKRHGTNLQNVATRMRVMSAARRELLTAVCKRLGIPTTQVHPG